MALRDAQVELTKRAILDAFLDVSNEGSERVTVAAVARRSGISPATIYRHFRDRDALVHAAANLHARDGVEGAEAWGIDDFGTHLGAIWGEMARNLPVARQAVVSEPGRELRLTRFAPFREAILRAIARAGGPVDEAVVDQVVACLAVLTSAHAFLDLHDRQGYDVPAAVDAATAGCRLLLQSIGVDPEEFLLTDPDTTPQGEP